MPRGSVVRAVLLALLPVLTGCDSGTPAGTDARPAGRRIQDPVGREVVLPGSVRRIATLTGASYEKAFLVGAGDLVVARAATWPPWMVRTNPRIAAVPVIRDSHNPNLEELLRLDLDLLFFWDHPDLVRKLERQGLTLICPQPERVRLDSADDLARTLVAEVEVYGQSLGGVAAERAAAWKDYFERTRRLVEGRTATLTAAERPRVYYVRGPSALSTHGAEQNISWFGELAGGDMVVRHAGAKGIAEVSLEQILVWDPEVVFVGRQYSPDLVLKDPRWRDVSAVRTGRVQVIPDGVFYWDSSSEGVLLLQYMAKILHPALFQDIDLEREVRDYYRTFYGYPLSHEEAARLLRGRGPDGQRRNPLGN